MLYEELSELDIISPIRNLLDREAAKIDYKTGKILIERTMGHASPWVFNDVLEHGERKCFKWIQFYWPFYRILPKECLGCWKVVVQPRNLDELFKIMQLQNELSIPAKCGAEVRSHVRSTGWQAFWYGPFGEGLEGAKKMYKTLAPKIRDILPITTEVILKRGCTEMERGRGPSNLWERTERDKLLQELLDHVLEMDENWYPQPGWIKTDIIARWIERAWISGDSTVWKFAQKDSFPPGPVTYHNQEKNILMGTEVPDDPRKIQLQ